MDVSKSFFGQMPEMPWKTTLWAVKSIHAVGGWEVNERRFISMDEYQKLIREYKDNFILDGEYHAGNLEGSV